MKNLLNVAVITVLILFSSCTVESIDTIVQNSNSPEETQIIEETQTSNFSCVDSDPQAQFINTGSVPFNFKVYDATGTLISEDLSVMPGFSSGMISFSSGDILFNVESVTTGISDQKVMYTMANCSQINLFVDSNNNLMDSVPTPL